MATQIFLNLPVKDLDRSVAFFTKLGYTFNPQFTDEKATCMIISDTIYVMLLTVPFFQTFHQKRNCRRPQSDMSAAYACQPTARMPLMN
jgi:predicted lactoylglutathione lyase